MKTLALVVFVLIGSANAAEEPFGETGFSDNTTITEAPGPDQDCPGELLCNWDGDVQTGYCWSFDGAQPPDYGAWAECYPEAFVCDAHLYFTQTGYYIGQTCDVYVWDDDGGLPGDVLCALIGAHPGPIAFWPSCSAHKFPLNCDAPQHFIGFWGNWPGQQCGWYVCADQSTPILCSVTKYAPGIGYPTGWGPINLAPGVDVGSLGLCEWVGGPTPARRATWGKIKSLY